MTDTSLDSLEITRNDDGTLTVQNPPLPEHIGVHAELWDSLETYTPAVDAPTGLEPPAGAYIELVGHADPDVDVAAQVLHIDATNARLAYRLVNQREDGVRVLVLEAWGEK